MGQVIIWLILIVIPVVSQFNDIPLKRFMLCPDRMIEVQVILDLISENKVLENGFYKAIFLDFARCLLASLGSIIKGR